MWELETINGNDGAAVQTALESGFQPFGAIDGYLLFRRRKPATLKPCEGCTFQVATTRFQVWNNPASGVHHECHRHPPVMLHTEDGYGAEHRPPANSLGCGEWQARGEK